MLKYYFKKKSQIFSIQNYFQISSFIESEIFQWNCFTNFVFYETKIFKILLSKTSYTNQKNTKKEEFLFLYLIIFLIIF